MPDGGLQATQQATPLTTHSMSKDMILSLRQSSSKTFWQAVHMFC